MVLLLKPKLQNLASVAFSVRNWDAPNFMLGNCTRMTDFGING